MVKLILELSTSIQSAHAYSIQNIDYTKRIISLGDPHHSADIMHMSFDNFKKLFYSIDIVTIRLDKFLKRKTL